MIPKPPSPPPDRIRYGGCYSAGLVILIFIVSFVAMGMFSCSRKTISNTSELTDSTHIEFKDRIVEVRLPGDTVEVEKRIECDSVTNKPKPFSIKRKSGRASLNLKVNSSGDLSVQGICDSLIKAINAKDKEIFHLRQKLQSTSRVITETKNSSFATFTEWFFFIVVAIGVVTLILKRYRII